ncbi:TrbI/VirB10 family protein [Rhizobium sp. BT-226]|uniref:TrbI/VirB10 family protein n=1 Tax=Rhizobium sp. BT-226 TaxID=2986922 RepID=UPI0021F72018|nr:TrbI/VirB10 family protein [Rhizobium sp. BT-226]MCW0021361.1 TrbI/VirB10 family protein [Rhizobium sp. BT-226]
MQDENGLGKGTPDPVSPDEEARLAAEREVLLNERRSRQTGTARSKKSKIMLAVLMGGAAFVFLVTAGPTGVLKALGVIGDSSRTSSVDMEVDREKDKPARLDFIVPASPQPVEEKPVDPNLAWNERFKELQNKLAEVERNKRPEISTNEIRDMLSSYNEMVTRKLTEERKAMAEENARLRMEAQRAEEERRRAEEAAKARAANAKELEKIDKAQRESGSVIVDERSDHVGGAGAAGSEDVADLDGNERFLKSAASSVVQTSVSQKLFDPSRMVVQGTIISAVLETAIDTQLPGNIRAQVMQPVYSFDGSRVLMPPGTMLVGQFNNDVDLAQKRVLIAWNRAVTPDGKSIAIGSTGTDTLGRAGTLGNVDNRYGTKFGAAMLISAINAIPSALSKRGGGSSGSSGTTINLGDQLASNAGSDLSDQSSGVMEKYLSLPPLIRIPQGEEIRVFVNRDLIFR